MKGILDLYILLPFEKKNQISKMLYGIKLTILVLKTSTKMSIFISKTSLMTCLDFFESCGVCAHGTWVHMCTHIGIKNWLHINNFDSQKGLDCVFQCLMFKCVQLVATHAFLYAKTLILFGVYCVKYERF